MCIPPAVCPQAAEPRFKLNLMYLTRLSLKLQAFLPGLVSYIPKERKAAATTIY